MVTIIHPSRSRPKIAYETALRWIERIGLPETEFEYILSLDNDDPELWNYKNHFPCLNFTIFRGDNRSAIDAINFPAKFYSAYRGQEENSKDFLIVISDDFDCPEDWGRALKKSICNDLDRVYKTEDGIQDWIITLPIMGWDYYKRFGYVYHPSYSHMFADTELTCVAEMTVGWSQLLGAPVTFKHLCESIPKDDLNKRNDSTFEEGRKNFIERKKRNFDLKPEEIKFPMPNNVYTRMQ